MKPLRGKLALVTGGTRGIGAAIAARLKADGARVIITGTRRGWARPGIELRAVDFSDRGATAAFARDVSKLGVDILVNNAGINKPELFADIAEDDFDRIQDVNLRAAFLLCRAALPHMRRKRWGRIVNITSIFGVISKERRGAYSASKFGLDGLTAALAAEAAADGVLANCVAPGFIETDLTRRILGPRGMAEMAKRIPMGRLGKPGEIAALVSWLAGPANTYMSGQQVVIDGGFSRV